MKNRMSVRGNRTPDALQVVMTRQADGELVTASEGFTAFVEQSGARLRRGLVARFGHEMGNEACDSAMAYAWAAWDRVSGMENPAGYLWKVACTTARRERRRRDRAPLGSAAGTTAAAELSDGELHRALKRLSDDSRTCVLLVHGFGWSYQDVAEFTGMSVSSVNNHVHRGMQRLRKVLAATNG